MSERVIREPGETDPEFSAAHDASDGAYLPTGPGRELSRWADTAMYRSEPLRAADGPRVTLINATPDPLGSLAALCAMYEGRVVRSLAEITDEQRQQAFADMQATQLQGPLEVAQFHFLVEGVTRAFTHQMVRERMAFFAQESMRFAVVEGEPWNERTAYPPGFADWPPGAKIVWNRQVKDVEQAYGLLINAGIPAEDARGLMPHAMTTRLHWVLDLRSLLHVAGLRLCTQAQFEWRTVMAQVVLALRDYGHSMVMPSDAHRRVGATAQRITTRGDAWQFELVADALRPVCYQQGRCGFMAKFDRGCTIRERVEANARLGRDSKDWDKPGGWTDDTGEHILVPAIQPSEWAADPTAARRG